MSTDAPTNVLAEEKFLVDESWRKETKVIDEAGKPKLVFHSTNNLDLTKFHEPQSWDIGIHFGNFDTAKARQTRHAYDPNKVKMIAAFLDLRHPIHLPDPGNWLGDETIKEVRKVDPAVFPLGFEFSQCYREALPDHKIAVVRDRLVECGYDGVVYPNKIEKGNQWDFSDEFSRLDKEMWEKINLDPENPQHYIPIRDHYYDLMRQLDAKRYETVKEAVPTDSYAVFSPEQIKIQSIKTLAEYS
jgi:hypothetical protein